MEGAIRTTLICTAITVAGYLIVKFFDATPSGAPVQTGEICIMCDKPDATAAEADRVRREKHDADMNAERERIRQVQVEAEIQRRKNEELMKQEITDKVRRDEEQRQREAAAERERIEAERIRVENEHRAAQIRFEEQQARDRATEERRNRALRQPHTDGPIIDNEGYINYNEQMRRSSDAHNRAARQMFPR